MDELPVTQFGAPDAPFCDLATARVTIIPAPLEYSVCYMKGTERGPQAILDASSQMELYDEELDWCPIEAGVYTRQTLDYSGMDHAAALKATGEAAREVLQRGQLPFTLGGEHSLSAPPIAAAKLVYKMIGYRFYAERSTGKEAFLLCRYAMLFVTIAVEICQDIMA